MVQVLPYVPSFLEQLTPHIGSAAQSIGAGIGASQRNKSDQSILQQIQSGAVKDVDLPIYWSKLSEGARKTYEPFIESHLRTQEAQAKEDIKNKGALQKTQSEKEAGRQELKPSFDELRRLSKEYGGRWSKKALLAKIPYTKGAEGREKLDKLGIWTADAVYTRFNKGTLAQVKWDDVKKQFAPNAGLSDAENEARISAMETIMGLPPNISAEKMESVIKKEQKQIDTADKKASATKQETVKITDDVAKQILEAVGNDNAKARELAKEMGYEI